MKKLMLLTLMAALTAAFAQEVIVSVGAHHGTGNREKR